MAASRTPVLTNRIEHHPRRPPENWDVLDLELSGAEMERIVEALGPDEELRSLLGH